MKIGGYQFCFVFLFDFARIRLTNRSGLKKRVTSVLMFSPETVF